MAAQRGLGLTLVVVVAGVVVGSLLGELMGRALPAGRVQDFLVGGLKINVVGVLGLVVSALTLRRL